jgi:mannosyltransferase
MDSMTDASSIAGDVAPKSPPGPQPAQSPRSEPRPVRSPLHAPQVVFWAVAALTLVAAILRAIGLNQQLWFDEMTTLVRWAKAPLLTIWATPHENNHLLNSILGHISVRLLGPDPWSLRLPAFLFGVATIPALYLLGRQITTRREAFLAAAVVTVSYHHIWFSQNARGYTAIAFWTVVTTLFLLLALRSGRRGWYVAYALAGAAGMASHLSMGFVLAGQALVWVGTLARATSRKADRGDRRQSDFAMHHGLRGAGVAFALIVVSSLVIQAPLLIHVYHVLSGKTPPATPVLEVQRPTEVQGTADVQGTAEVQGTPKVQGTAEVQGIAEVQPPPRVVVGHDANMKWHYRWAFMETVRNFRSGLGTWGVVAAALLFCCGLVSYVRQSRLVFALFLLPSLSTIIGTVLLQHSVVPRYFFHSAGFGALMLVRGATVAGAIMAGRPPMGSARHRVGVGLGTAFIVVLIAISALSLERGYRLPKQDYAGAMRFVEEKRTVTEPVFTAGGMADFAYSNYYRKPWRRIGDRVELDSIHAAPGRAWLIYTFPWFLRRSPGFLEGLQEHCPPIRRFTGTLGGGDVIVCALD